MTCARPGRSRGLLLEASSTGRASPAPGAAVQVGKDAERKTRRRRSTGRVVGPVAFSI